MGMGGDNDTNYQLIDHAIVGVRSKLEVCLSLTLPFFAKLQHEELHVECFPYRIAIVRRHARADKLEPFLLQQRSKPHSKGSYKSTNLTVPYSHAG